MNQFEMDFAWKKICSELQDQIPEEYIEPVREKFSLLEADKKGIVLGYRDPEFYEDFTSKYMSEIYNAAYTVCGGMISVKFKKVTEKTPAEKAAEKNGEARQKKAKRKAPSRKRSALGIVLSLICIVLAVLILIVGVNFISNITFREQFYNIHSSKVHSNLRIIQISDLHSAEYGSRNGDLVHRVTMLHPDIIVMTGDCIDTGGSVETVADLCEKLAEIAPTYYVYGNNEEALAFDCEMSLEALDARFGFNDELRDAEKLYGIDGGLKETLEKSGVKVLFNEYDTVTVNGTEVDVFGALNYNPSAFWPYAGSGYYDYIYSGDPNHFKLFLCHAPFLFEELNGEEWGDLALCGHTHGGLMDLPFVGRVYAPGYGLLPEMKNHYVYGQYEIDDDTALIVSSGMTNKGMVRINNRPELVVIDVSRY